MRINRPYITGIALFLVLLLVLVPAPAAADQYVGGIPLETGAKRRRLRWIMA